MGWLALLMRGALANQENPGPMDPIDADTIERSWRVRHQLDRRGFGTVHDRSKYPRGVSVGLSSGQHVTLTPHEHGGWAARIHHADVPSARPYDTRITERDFRVGAALRVHLTRPAVVDAMRYQADQIDRMPID